MSGNDVDAFFADMLAEENKKIRHVLSTLDEKEKKRQKLEKTSPHNNNNVITPLISQPSKSSSSSSQQHHQYQMNGTPLDLLQSMQRDINALTSHDRSTRLQSFQRLNSAILNQNTISNQTRVFLLPHMIHQLLKCVSNDSVESCREQSASLLLHLLSSIDTTNNHTLTSSGGEMSDEWLSFLIPVLDSRLNDKKKSKNSHMEGDLNYHSEESANSTASVVVIEPSEEVRLILAKILTTVVEKCANRAGDLLLNYLDTISEVIKKGYDDFHNIKVEMCKCTVLLCQLLPQKLVSLFSPALVTHLKPCLSHQRSLVRENSVRALNELVMNGAHDSIEELFKDGVLRQLIVDHSSSVRRLMMETVQNWAINLSDRWSYQFQLVYIVCVAMTDEIQSIQLLAKETLDILGKMHEQDNEQEVNDIKVYDTDYQLRHYANIPLPEPYHERPELGCRMIISKHAKKIIETILEEMKDWNIPKRMVAVRTLQRVIILCESSITQHLHRLVHEFFSASDEDELDILRQVHTAVQLTGYFVEPETYIPIVWSFMKSEYATSPVLVSNVLKVFARLLQGTNPNTINWQVLIEGIMSKLSSCNFLIYGDSNMMKQACLEVVQALLKCSKENGIALNNDVSLPLFVFIVRLCAQRGVPKEIAELGVQCLDQVRALKNLSNMAELYSLHFERALEEITRDVASWDKTSPNLYSFEALIKHGPHAAAKHLDAVLSVFSRHIVDDARDLTVVLVLFAGMNGLLSNIASSISRTHIDRLVRLIGPNLIWKIGPMKAHIRKAAVACFSCILRQKAIASDDVQLLRYISSDMLTHLRSCLDSDEDMETRVITVKLFEDLIPLIHQNLVDEQWEAITKDFTDRQLEEGIEILSSESVKVLFQIILLVPCDGDVQREKSIVELIVNALVLHLDSPNTKIRTSIYQCLSSILQRACAEQSSPTSIYAAKSEWILDAFRNKADKTKKVVRDCGVELSQLCAMIDNR